MKRELYVYQSNNKVSITGCSTCKYSRLKNNEKDVQEKCKGTKVVRLGNGMVEVISLCSGESNIYSEDLIIVNNRNYYSSKE